VLAGACLLTRFPEAAAQNAQGSGGRGAGSRITPSAPRPFPNLVGTWSGTYKGTGGIQGTTNVEITAQRRGRISGTLQDDGTGPVLALRGTVTRRGRFRSTSRGSGIVSKKAGTLSADGNTISGTWRDRFGRQTLTGTFTLTRLP
jgi:hypothetical protein